jgi:Flp pilus assembly protein TadD
MRRTFMSGSKEKKMEINLAGHRRVPLAILAAFAAVPLFAQPALIEQRRAAIGRGDSDAAIEILEKAVAQAPKSAEAHYALGSAYGAKVQAGGMMAAAQGVCRRHPRAARVREGA